MEKELAEKETETAILFADVSGSTRLYETAGDSAALAAIEQCIEIFCQQTLAEAGRVIKKIGDEVMAQFPSANAAANAAIEMQLAVQSLAPVAGEKLGIRVGFHLGPVVERDNDVFGDTVNLAARLAGLAARGQIMTSLDTVKQMNLGLKSSCRPLHAIPVKGKAQEVALCELMWQQSDDVTTMAAPRSVAVAASVACLRLSYHDLTYLLNAEKTSLTLGRDATCDLPILDRMASRVHGKIERRGNKFFLVDHSANGTYVQPSGGAETVLRREEFALSGGGTITFGQSHENTTEMVAYVVEQG
ncbi:MAG: adenylate/guanylate cyclase domain-containing protein [Pseudomonadota bacterium]